jgi:hypothetical protein
MTEALRLNEFYELNHSEMFEVDGGSILPWEAGIAFVALMLVVAKESFEAGRQCYRDICK